MRIVNKVIMGLLLLSVLWAAPAAVWARAFDYTRTHYVYLPIQMQFADRRTGDPIGRSSNMIMYGGQTREFAIDAVDFNGNGVIDIRDFKVWDLALTVSVDVLISGEPDVPPGARPHVSFDVPIPSNLTGNELIQLAPELRDLFERGFEAALWNSLGALQVYSVTSTPPDLLHVAFNAEQMREYQSSTDPRVTPPARLPRRVGLVQVTPRQQLGSDSSSYNEQIAHFFYTLYWGARNDLEDETRRGRLLSKAETPEMTIVVRATDQGGKGGDNGGGSCNALAWGTASLLVPGLLLLRRRKG